MKKKVYHCKNGNEWTTEGDCSPQKLTMSSKYIYPYWYDAIMNVAKYEKQRGLADIHKFCSDDRILRGLRLYRNKHITDVTVTTVYGGDVRAIVKSQNDKKEYTVIVKNFLPEKLPQYNYEREYFISNMIITCSCPDFLLTRYRSNASMFCVHVMAVFFYLINKWNMPKIFITPEEKICGYKKSDTKEIETNISAIPLVKFTQFMNILSLDNFRGMKPACGISIHRISNETNNEIGAPIWLTYVKTDDVKRMINALSIVLNNMSEKSEHYYLKKVKPRSKKWVFIEPFKRKGKIVHGFYRKKPLKKEMIEKWKN